MTWYISCFKALSLRQNKLSQSKASHPFHTACQLSRRQSYILLSKSQYSLLNNVAISSNRFVYNEKFHTKVQNNMYLQYNLFFFHIKELQQILCVLSTEQLLTLLRSLPLWQWTFVFTSRIQIRHWQGSKKIWSLLKCHCTTASYYTSNIDLPSLSFISSPL